MRIGVVPTTLLEWIASRLNLVPIPAVEVLFCMLHSRIIMSAVRLGIFGALEASGAHASDLAARLELDPVGAQRMCEALVAARYLRRDQQANYHLRAVARRYLVPSSPHYVGHYVELNYDQWDWLAKLDGAVQSGHSIDLHQSLERASESGVRGSWSRYLEGLADLAREAATEIAAKTPIAARGAAPHRKLLDVGGGHGTFSVALCRRYPDLTAEILDLHEAIAAGESIARRYAGPAVAPRIHFRAGNALAPTLGPDASYDAVLIFQLLHHLPAQEIPALFTRAVRALRPGGWISVIDLLDPPRGHRFNAAAAYTALYFYVTSRGHSYAPEQIEAWLIAAGCSRIRRFPLLHVPGQPLIAGQRPLA